MQVVGFGRGETSSHSSLAKFFQRGYDWIGAVFEFVDRIIENDVFRVLHHTVEK